MAIYHHTTRMIGWSNGGSPAKALAYISGTSLSDQRTGETFDFKEKPVQDVQVLLPKDAPVWAKEIQKLVLEDREKGLQLLSDIANAAEKRSDSQVYREIEFSLPRELSYEQNKALATEYVQDQFCGMGMLAIQSFHMEVCEETGELNPHCHTFLLTRELEEEGLSEFKNRDWNQKEVHLVWREQWAQYASFYLKKNGYDITLDHRSYKDQGIDIEPQTKLGKGVNEQEKRASGGRESGLERTLDFKNLEFKTYGFGEEGNQEFQDLAFKAKGFIDSQPATDRVHEFRQVQLRNLYRILRKPEIVFEMVTRNHTTFMWGDVQKKLHQYVDSPELFQRLDNRLRNSSELLLLKPHDVISTKREKNEGITLDGGSIIDVSMMGGFSKSDQHNGGPNNLEPNNVTPHHVERDRAIYTTHSMLGAEKALVRCADTLSSKQNHTVSESSLERGLENTNTRMKEKGYRLSEDQEKAIRHLTSEGQLKCVVGYAGAGKTTALEACREIWEDSGYRVYGLAPTGRASKNLEDSGIKSTILHSFLKSFEEGRCQYSHKSVLVLDEGGMVDVERFQKLLSAGESLGVKIVVIGDGAQLQPVEAGPAFRLVTSRVGVSRLEEVVRQKEDWQKEATVLFGKQETKEALEAYQSRGHIHIVEENLPTLNVAPLNEEPFNENPMMGTPIIKGPSPEDVVKCYEMTARTSGLIFREILKDLSLDLFETGFSSDKSAIFSDFKKNPNSIKNHEDYKRFQAMRSIQKEAARKILDHADTYRPILEARHLDPLEMARLFVDKGQDKMAQYDEAADILMERNMSHLIGVKKEQGQGVDVRGAAKVVLIEHWKQVYNDTPDKKLAMMAYSNRDVRDMNVSARNYLKEEGKLGQSEFTYTITREVEDDFGRKTRVKEKRGFSEGDRIVFTQNRRDLGVTNGTMGTISSLDKNKIEVSLDGGKELTFTPNLFSYFDQGWAITIHKTQGETAHETFLLASHEMNQNLTYVGMTRHENNVHVYGSSLDFWREEKVIDVLSKSGDKLGASDYLDSKSLESLMKAEDKFLEKLLTRLSDELHAMGAVSREVFKNVADHFFGRTTSEKDSPPILIPETDREELRAQILLQKTSSPKDLEIEAPSSLETQEEISPHLMSPQLLSVVEDMKHPAFKKADFYKKVFQEGLKKYGEEDSIRYWQEKREPYMKIYEQKIETVDLELGSPLLSHLSDKTRTLAKNAALEDPDRALSFIIHLQADKKAELEKLSSIKEVSPQQAPSHDKKLSLNDPSLNESSYTEVKGIMSQYFRYKDLQYKIEHEDRPGKDLRQEFDTLGKHIFNNKLAFDHIKEIDPNVYTAIKEKFEEKKLVEQTKESVREFDRGGYSL